MYTLVHNNITYTISAPVYPINLVVDHYVIIKGQGLSIPDRLFPNNKTEIFFNLGDKVMGFNNIDASTSIPNDSTVSGVRSHKRHSSAVILSIARQLHNCIAITLVWYPLPFVKNIIFGTYSIGFESVVIFSIVVVNALYCLSIIVILLLCDT